MTTLNGHHHANGTANGRSRLPLAIADKLPPHNLEAEREVLGAILIDPGALAGVREVLAERHFYREAHRLAYRAILALDDRGAPVEPLALLDELRRRGHLGEVGGEAAIDSFLEAAPHAANAPYYAALVAREAAKREAALAGGELYELAHAPGTEPADLVERALARLGGLAGLGAEEEEAPVPGWPEPPGEDAWHGVMGELVRRIAPHTEADPAAVLVQALAAFGSLVGRRPHWRVEGTRHGLNLFACVVGDSSKARKGTSWDHVMRLLGNLDTLWAGECVQHGLSSGEGLIWAVRDPITKREKVAAQNGAPIGFRDVEVDPGVADKRLLVVETEFGGVLTAMGRENNILSVILRQAWDSGRLRTLTKNSPARATDAHIGVIGHITCEELTKKLSGVDAANGFANRFLWCCSRRSRFLPEGGNVRDVDFADVIAGLREAREFATVEDLCVVRDDAARELWRAEYPRLSRSRPGLLGASTSRAEAQVMRLAALYAILDCSVWVRECHLRAALALWGYCERSALYLFGDHLGDPEAEKLLAALKAAGERGLTRKAITRSVFSNHKSGDALVALLSRLERTGLIRRDQQPTAGRPVEVWTVGEGPTGAN